MKTAISVPEETFTRVEQRAKTLGVTRSEFYTRAAAYYLDWLESESLASQIDAAVEMIGSDESGRLASAAGRRRLAQDAEEDW